MPKAHTTAVVLAVLIIALWLYALTIGGLLEQNSNSTMTGLIALLNVCLVTMAAVLTVRHRPKSSVVLALAAFVPVGLYLLLNPFPAFFLGALELALLVTVIFTWWRTRKPSRA